MPHLEFWQYPIKHFPTSDMDYTLYTENNPLPHHKQQYVHVNMYMYLPWP